MTVPPESIIRGERVLVGVLVIGAKAGLVVGFALHNTTDNSSCGRSRLCARAVPPSLKRASFSLHMR